MSCRGNFAVNAASSFLWPAFTSILLSYALSQALLSCLCKSLFATAGELLSGKLPLYCLFCYAVTTKMLGTNLHVSLPFCIVCDTLTRLCVGCRGFATKAFGYALGGAVALGAAAAVRAAFAQTPLGIHLAQGTLPEAPAVWPSTHAYGK